MASKQHFQLFVLNILTQVQIALNSNKLKDKTVLNKNLVNIKTYMGSSISDTDTQFFCKLLFMTFVVNIPLMSFAILIIHTLSFSSNGTRDMPYTRAFI